MSIKGNKKWILYLCLYSRSYQLHVLCPTCLLYVTVDVISVLYELGHRHAEMKRAKIWKIRLNSSTWENWIRCYLLMRCDVINVIVCETGRGKLAADKSRAPGQVMWKKALPHDTVQLMVAALRNSNKIICKHRKLHVCSCLESFHRKRQVIWL